MRRIYAILATAQIFLALVFPRAYSLEKLGLLLLLLLTLFAALLLKDIVLRGKDIFLFFLAFVFLHVISVVNGVIKGNDYELVLDGLRLFVVFPMIFAVLWLSLGDFKYGHHIHKVVLISATLIVAINYIAIFENYFSLYILPADFVDENLLRVGFHDGYVQLTSHNIGSVYFIFGYIFCYCLMASKTSKAEWFVLFLVTSIAIASGRRGLWLAIAVAPILFYYLKKILRTKMGDGKKYPITIFYLSTLVFLSYFFLTKFDFSQFLERASSALTDEGSAIRKTQAKLMLDDLSNRPLLGAGIGGKVNMDSLQRSSFELTYVQMIFNNGIILTALIAVVFIAAFLKMNQMARRGAVFCVVTQSMVFGTLLLFVGAITNPYLGSFDFLLMIGTIPFLVSQGFASKRYQKEI